MIIAGLYIAGAFATVVVLMRNEAGDRPGYCAASALLWPLFWLAVGAMGAWLLVEEWLDDM
jgi:hypothetical protein